MLNSKILKEALAAARAGDKVDLSELTIPWGGGSIVKAGGETASRVRSVVWSDKAVDEDNDTIEPSGWHLDRFLKNGAILWAHDSSTLPLGKPLNTRVEGQGPMGKLLGDVEFTDTYDFANLVLQLVDAGVLRGVSVGFRPIKWLWNEERGGVDFIEQRLLEGSIVPVGSNPNSMIAAAQSKSLDTAPMIDWLERCLDDGDAYTASPREELEILHKALGPMKRTKAGVVVPKKTEPEVTPGEVKLAEESVTLLKVMVEAVKAGELSADIFDAPLAELGITTETRGAISWDEAHPHGTPRAPKDAEWSAGSGNVACAHRSGLSHHRTEGDAVVWLGLTEAMDALLGGTAEVPESDARAAYDHLARHYHDDFDEEPPAYRTPGEEPPITVTMIEEEVTAAVIGVLESIDHKERTAEEVATAAAKATAEIMEMHFLREAGRLPA